MTTNGTSTAASTARKPVTPRKRVCGTRTGKTLPRRKAPLPMHKQLTKPRIALKLLNDNSISGMPARPRSPGMDNTLEKQTFSTSGLEKEGLPPKTHASPDIMDIGLDLGIAPSATVHIHGEEAVALFRESLAVSPSQLGPFAHTLEPPERSAIGIASALRFSTSVYAFPVSRRLPSGVLPAYLPGIARGVLAPDGASDVFKQTVYLPFIDALQQTVADARHAKTSRVKQVRGVGSWPEMPVTYVRSGLGVLVIHGLTIPADGYDQDVAVLEVNPKHAEEVMAYFRETTHNTQMSGTAVTGRDLAREHAEYVRWRTRSDQYAGLTEYTTAGSSETAARRAGDNHRGARMWTELYGMTQVNTLLPVVNNALVEAVAGVGDPLVTGWDLALSHLNRIDPGLNLVVISLAQVVNLFLDPPEVLIPIIFENMPQILSTMPFSPCVTHIAEDAIVPDHKGRLDELEVEVQVGLVPNRRFVLLETLRVLCGDTGKFSVTFPAPCGVYFNARTCFNQWKSILATRARLYEEETSVRRDVASSQAIARVTGDDSHAGSTHSMAALDVAGQLRHRLSRAEDLAVRPSGVAGTALESYYWSLEQRRLFPQKEVGWEAGEWWCESRVD
ncbi:hypothetical protein J8273_1335 [Carpediemonas membranifera]|uniref:Uncharacterized protein n=1 Tax=Carpediemonas membranifera TaxID=201153 RepID=A0A8J6E4I4_9EUKA|nr:hypothetical protein J8273_1335 [Carpediemonas membranifera]|eukprot:KAG9396986.1 hypothetical protein J8273_1335 [Carpediemonas membranifera]